MAWPGSNRLITHPYNDAWAAELNNYEKMLFNSWPVSQQSNLGETKPVIVNF